MPRANPDLSLVPDDPEAQSEEDAQADAELAAIYAEVREREKTEVAAVEVPRYPRVPQRDPQGRLVRGEDGKYVKGPQVLYFRRLEPGTLGELRRKHTHPVPVRRRGRMEYEDQTDDEALTLDVVYTAMVPWCRARYFDNRELWGDEAVGTGKEFLRVRLTPGELSYCADAVLRLEGLGDDRERLEKA
jgi:hypothetical protein